MLLLSSSIGNNDCDDFCLIRFRSSWDNRRARQRTRHVRTPHVAHHAHMRKLCACGLQRVRVASRRSPSGLGAQRRGPQRAFLAVQAVLPITWDEDACLQHEIHQFLALLVEHLPQQPCNILRALSNILTSGHSASMQHSLKANALRHGMQVSAAAPPFVLGAHGEARTQKLVYSEGSVFKPRGVPVPGRNSTP